MNSSSYTSIYQQPSMCIAYCYSQSYKYAGLENGQEFFKKAQNKKKNYENNLKINLEINVIVVIAATTHKEKITLLLAVNRVVRVTKVYPVVDRIQYMRISRIQPHHKQFIARVRQDTRDAIKMQVLECWVDHRIKVSLQTQLICAFNFVVLMAITMLALKMGKFLQKYSQAYSF